MFIILLLETSGKHSVYDFLHSTIVLKHVLIAIIFICKNPIVCPDLRLDVLTDTVS